MFPMTTNTCYLLPIWEARKIPVCKDFAILTRHKCLITDIITIGTSALALGTATASMILTKNLEKKVNQFQHNIKIIADHLELGEARMIQFEKNQMQLGMILQQSENLLNSTINQVNQHSSTLEAFQKQLNDYQQNLLTLQHRVIENKQDAVHRFLSLAIHDIINNKPTLGFLHPSDLQLVIKTILQENNITVSNMTEQIPMAELITKLIIRQQIDFVPAELYSDIDNIEIGKLTFTTFYAMPNEQKPHFNIYKVITGPFIHNNKVVRLAQMPSYIGINQKRNSSITWASDDLSTCTFDQITTCRETPAEKPLGLGNTSLEQILDGKKLMSSRTEETKLDLPHIQQIQSGQWLISTNNTYLHCIRVPTQPILTSRTRIWSENSQVFVPPVALISVPNGTTIHCPGFNLPGSIIPDTKAIINIIKNLSQIEENEEIIDMHKELNSNATWEKLPYVSGDVNALIQHVLSQTTQESRHMYMTPLDNQDSKQFPILHYIVIGILVVVIIIALATWCIKRSVASKITIALPSLIG
ncbi:unnamed protein product [Rotaria magnacalcarata]|uniref:Uncharacterized protein n=2 Tax=Rotaria magnacalcarata TaxID=392030 RepID=A0A815B719_9BILA|nr:unnamed protein product [Rotaria magnacalcarata]CAF1587607.1 unnamed protein product [Rotaria magnacalcarata]CAF3821015.1 unnamed protein product [Rotaria magnacalcarata]CAF3825278.1 unnamed protein product [Rotaria magnacalcarata]CAF3834477.1 unnamed protein product [Rotaria magnacalcarata]